uniref:SCP domain-containing protein n=1 Tax=Mesocestoides corti TaxID=53468 RepID=A0A5K3FSW5_MESCO
MLLQSTDDPNIRFKGVVFFRREAKNYNYATNRCKDSCSRYKQIVWAASTKVGCAKAKCPAKNSAGTTYHMVCVFNNADYYHTERPYEKGVSCSKCRDGESCLRNQCATTS